ncbi:MAG TPA: ABC transporter permease [Candidatus Dormibacteraeota bacterium]|nr:ABC transporter permease [Candidatus Dormibacteraeota bacterium]
MAAGTASGTTALRREMGALLGFMERQRNIYKRFWAWEVVFFAYSLISVCSIGYLASGLPSIGGGAQVDTRTTQLYLLAGALLWSYLSLIFMEVAYAIGIERWEGTIEYTFMAPVRRTTHLMGVWCATVIYGLVRTAVVIAVIVPLFHIDLHGVNGWSVLVILLVATLPLAAIGIMVAIMPLLAPEKGEQMSISIQGVFLLVSGVYYPVSVLPQPLHALGLASPLTYVLDGIRDALLRGRSVGDMLPMLGMLVLSGLVLIPVALWLFSRAEQRAKRLGLLKRSG